MRCGRVALQPPRFTLYVQIRVPWTQGIGTFIERLSERIIALRPAFAAFLAATADSVERRMVQGVSHQLSVVDLTLLLLAVWAGL